MEKMFATAYGECIAFSIENGEQSMEAEVIDLFCGVGGLTRGLMQDLMLLLDLIVIII